MASFTSNGPRILTSSAQGPRILASSAQGPRILTSAFHTGPRILDSSRNGPRILTSSVQGPRILTSSAQGPRILTASFHTGPRILDSSRNGPRILTSSVQGPRILDSSRSGPRILTSSFHSGPRLLDSSRTGPRLLDSCRTGPRILSSSTQGPRILTSSFHSGPRILSSSTQGPRILTSSFHSGPRILTSARQGPRILSPANQARFLHMTGPATFPSDILTTSEKSTASLKSSVSESNDIRTFTTTPTPFASRDTSTIDFAFFPSYASLMEPASSEIRVPLLPTNFFPSRTGIHSIPYTVTPSSSSDTTLSATGEPLAHDDMPSVLLPTISTASCESTHFAAPSAMSDVHDGHGHGVDFTELVKDGLRDVAAAAVVPVEQAKGMVGQVWAGLIDDLFGKKTTKKVVA